MIGRGFGETGVPHVSTLTIDLFSSLDGFAAAEDWPGYWGRKVPSSWRGWRSSWPRTTSS
jgi:hypothetical protein